MGATSYFKPDFSGPLRVSDGFGEPTEKTVVVDLLEGNHHMILRADTGDAEPLDLVFTEEQAAEFARASVAICERLGIET